MDIKLWHQYCYKLHIYRRKKHQKIYKNVSTPPTLHNHHQALRYLTKSIETVVRFISNSNLPQMYSQMKRKGHLPNRQDGLRFSAIRARCHVLYENLRV